MMLVQHIQGVVCIGSIEETMIDIRKDYSGQVLRVYHSLTNALCDGE